MDVLTPEQRRYNMQCVKGRDTKPEMLLRRGLHARGFRYRLHCSSLPGKPDLIFPKFQAVIFAHGCFWHGHGCHLFKWPVSRRDFWRKKIEGTQTRDHLTIEALRRKSWRILVVWECALRGPIRPPLEELLNEIETFLTHSRQELRFLSGSETSIRESRF